MFVEAMRNIEHRNKCYIWIWNSQISCYYSLCFCYLDFADDPTWMSIKIALCKSWIAGRSGRIGVSVTAPTISVVLEEWDIERSLLTVQL